MATIKSFDPEKRNRQMKRKGAFTERMENRFVTIQGLKGLTVPEQTLRCLSLADINRGH